MTAAVVALVACVFIVELVRLVLEVRAERAPLIGRYVGHRVVLHLKSGRSLRGVIASVGPDAIVLRDAELLGETGSVHPADGANVVQLRDLDFFQVLAEPAPDGTGELRVIGKAA